MKNKPTMIYIMNTNYPNAKAHSIEMTKVMYSLQDHFDIHAVFSHLETGAGDIYEAVQDRYGLDLSRVRFEAVGTKNMQGLKLYKTLFRLMREDGKGAFFYSRKFGVAGKILNTRFLHGRKVVLESHKKDGYFKEEKVSGSPYAELRSGMETEKRSIPAMRRIYRIGNLTLFPSSGSMDKVREELPEARLGHMWYPVEMKPDAGVERDKTFVYCGSVTEKKLFGLLVDALAQCREGVTLDVVGGHPKGDEAWLNKARELGLMGRIRFVGRFDYKELPKILQQYRYGIATMEGIKVVDYVENGLIPVVPRINTYTGVFPEECVLYFDPDNAQSLAEAMNGAEECPPSLEPLTPRIADFVIPRFGERLARIIKENLF